MQLIEVASRQHARAIWRSEGGAGKPLCGHCGKPTWRMHRFVSGDELEAYCSSACLDAVMAKCNGEACNQARIVNAQAAAYASEHIAGSKDRDARARIDDLRRSEPGWHRRENTTRGTCGECLYLEQIAKSYRVSVAATALRWIACGGRCEGCGTEISLGDSDTKATARKDHDHLAEEILSALQRFGNRSDYMDLSIRGWLCNACNAIARAGATPWNTTGMMARYLLNAGWYNEDCTEWNTGLRAAAYLREMGLITAPELLDADYYTLNIYDVLDAVERRNALVHMHGNWIGRHPGAGKPKEYTPFMHLPPHHAVA